jgi:hypothetical protein
MRIAFYECLFNLPCTQDNSVDNFESLKAIGSNDCKSTNDSGYFA